MLTDYTAAKFYMDVVQIVATVIIGIYVWWQNKNRATTSAIKDVDDKHSGKSQQLDKRLDAHSERMLVMEKDIKALPKEAHISDLYDKMNSLNREMGELAAALTATNQLMRVHQDYLMNKNT